MNNKKEMSRIKRHRRIRTRLSGTPEKPRLVIHRSLKNLFGQVIDDTNSSVMFSMSTQDKSVREKFPNAGNIKAAEFFGQEFAKRIKEKGIVKVVFDRGGYLYHGRIKTFADGIRKGGIAF